MWRDDEETGVKSLNDAPIARWSSGQLIGLIIQGSGVRIPLSLIFRSSWVEFLNREKLVRVQSEVGVAHGI